MITTKKIKYCLRSTGVKFLMPIFWVMSKMLVGLCEREVYEGIIILYLPGRDSFDPMFITRTKEALKLLAELDERRFRRVQKEISMIIRSTQNRYLGCYQRLMKLFMISFHTLPYEKCEELAAKLYICTLVHHATQGHLSSCGIDPAMTCDKRIQGLCSLEEYRVACKFNDGRSILWERVLRVKASLGRVKWEMLLK